MVDEMYQHLGHRSKQKLAEILVQEGRVYLYGIVELRSVPGVNDGYS